MEVGIPGKLSARPVQQPATPAFMTVEKRFSKNKKMQFMPGNIHSQ